MSKEKKQKKKGKKMSSPEEPHINTTDDDYRDEVDPARERPDELCHEDWARPGDEEKPEEDLPKPTDMPNYGEE